MSEVVNVFEQASRQKLRYKAKAGLVTTEDLWELPLTQLDTMAVAVNEQINAVNKGSFLKPKQAADETLSLTLQVLIYIMTVRQQEAADARAIAEKKAQKAKLLEILGSKQEQKLQNLSEEELLAKINAL